jgi:phospholipid-binding lipoprotein MlaA
MIYGRGSLRLILCLILMSLVMACSSAKHGQNDDPFEGFNRKSNEFNQVLDQNLLRPLAMIYAGYVPERLQTTISNVAQNLSTPGDVANNLLQGDLESGVKNTAKFLVNSTLGLGGIIRPAEELDIQGKKTDFGQTLYEWGAQEGPYIVLPFVGPSTGRRTFGILGDLAIDPIGRVLTADGHAYTFGVKVADVLGNRARFAKMFDSVLYGSADSYEQTKLIYLQARRFQLDGPQEDEYFDPYDEIFSEE